jgi:hypothetical protein
VNPARHQNTVLRAVALIGPGERRAECVNAVHIALTMVGGAAKDMQKHSDRRGKPGKRAVAGLHKALRDVQKWIQDPNLPVELREIISAYDVAHAIKYVEEVRTKPVGKRYPYKAIEKLAAAEEAHALLQQFNKKISITKGSTFCKLTALLYGDPRADLQWSCRKLLEDKQLRS